MAPNAETKEGIPPPLPPSVENAYRKKCIALKRRLMEVEESNDQARVRKVRLERGIRKMRLERAFLLDQLAKRMRKNPHILGPDGLEEEESEDSSEGPPTPHPDREARPFRRRSNKPRNIEERPPLAMNGSHDQINAMRPQPAYQYGQPVPSAHPHPAAYGPPVSQEPLELQSLANMYYSESLRIQPDLINKFNTREELERYLNSQWNQLTDADRLALEQQFDDRRQHWGLPPLPRPGAAPIQEASRDNANEVAGPSREAGGSAGAGGGFTAVNG